MDNNILKARLGKAPTKPPQVAGKTPWAEHIRVSKTRTKKGTKSIKSSKGESPCCKESERQQQQSERQQQQSEQQQRQNS